MTRTARTCALARARERTCAPHVRSARADEVAEVQRLMHAGDAEAALARARKGVAADPQDAKLRFLEGVILMDQQRDAEALALFQRMTEDFPELADPYNNIAALEVRAGRPLLARAALESALRNDPGHVAARTNLGDVDLMLAIEAWQQAAKARPDDTTLQRKLLLARQILAAPAR